MFELFSKLSNPYDKETFKKPKLTNMQYQHKYKIYWIAKSTYL